MKFKEGDAVEVLRKGKEQYDSWFPGEIISVDDHNYTVQYELFLNRVGNLVLEDICEENVRPHPPSVKGERWVLGDITEAFDLHCWKVGKVAKVLNNNRYLVELFGAIQPKEFQRSKLRVRQTWKNNKWVAVDKVGGNNQINNAGNASKYSPGQGWTAPKQVIYQEAGTKENKSQEHFETFPPETFSKRKRECNFETSPVDVAMAEAVTDKKTTKARRGDMRPIGTPPVLKQIGVGSSTQKNMGKKCMIRSNMDDEKKKPYNDSQAHKESSECSVGSCGGDGIPEYALRPTTQESSWDVAAQSLCPSKSRRKHLASPPEDGDDIHKLELRAYKSTMQALHASGPLSWEQESLLTNLRLSLHISTEEHLLQLRHLLSSQVL